MYTLALCSVRFGVQVWETEQQEKERKSKRRSFSVYFSCLLHFLSLFFSGIWLYRLAAPYIYLICTLAVRFIRVHSLFHGISLFVLAIFISFRIRIMFHFIRYFLPFLNSSLARMQTISPRRCNEAFSKSCVLFAPFFLFSLHTLFLFFFCVAFFKYFIDSPSWLSYIQAHKQTHTHSFQFE